MSELVTIGEYLANVRIIGVDDGAGLENVVNSFQVTPNDGVLELRAGNPGDPGPEGPPAYPIRWRGDVADRAALEAIRSSLGTEHAGYTYRLVSDNSMQYWDGSAFYPFLNAFGAEGPRGTPNTLTVGTIETLPEGEQAYITITGEPPNQVLNAGFPRGGVGEQGDPGSPGPIMAAPDVDGSVIPGDMYVLAYDSVTEKWVPRPWPGAAGPWGLASSSFSTGSNVSASPSTIATITIPAQPTAWRPRIEGGVLTVAHVSSGGDTRVDVEVRIGSATGPVCAVAHGMPVNNWYRANFIPYFGTTLTPASTVGVIPANTTTTLYVIISRNLGTRNFSWSNAEANLIVYAEPVIAP